MSVFLSVVFAFEYGILNQTRIRSLNAEALMISQSDQMGNSKASLLLVISNLVVERQYFCCEACYKYALFVWRH